ncbi:hypothetical protein L610_002300000640 [Aminobacter sp. J44]|nr:hypothetical protein L610_002300000640 [Aminobacter sp. J44]
MPKGRAMCAPASMILRHLPLCFPLVRCVPYQWEVRMAVRVDLNISLDGFATTTDQTAEDPFGRDWSRLVAAYADTRTVRERVFKDTSGAGTTGVDDQYARAYPYRRFAFLGGGLDVVVMVASAPVLIVLTGRPVGGPYRTVRFRVSGVAAQAQTARLSDPSPAPKRPRPHVPEPTLPFAGSRTGSLAFQTLQ